MRAIPESSDPLLHPDADARPARRRRTILGLMLLVALIAIALGMWVSTRNWLRRWEDLRVVMNQQRDATQAVVLDAIAGLPPLPAGTTPPGYITTLGTGTRTWSIDLTTAERHAKGRPPLARASGSLGNTSLAPIRVEVLDPSADGPWVDRLARDFTSRGWAFTIARPAPGSH